MVSPQTSLSEFMSYPVITVGPGESVAEVRRLFTRHDINHLPVVDDDLRPVGMVSARDVERLTSWRAFFQPDLEEARRTRLLESLVVAEVMRQPAETIEEVASIAEAAAKINERQFHSLPVVDFNGRIVGIITAHDLLRLAYPERLEKFAEDRERFA